MIEARHDYFVGRKEEADNEKFGFAFQAYLRPQWRVVQIQAEDFVPFWMIVGRPDYYRTRARAAQAAYR